MSPYAEEIVRGARALIGAPFRPQGRDPGTGLDCVGLVLQVFAIPQQCVRRDYRLRGPRRQEVEAQLSRQFRRVTRRSASEGDVLLCAVARDQMHLAIHCGGSFIHADARLRRIVETPGAPAWPVVGVYRSPAADRKSS